MPSVFGLPPDAFCLHLAAESSAAIASNVLLRTPVSRRNASPFSSLTESNLIAAPLWRQRIKPWLIEGYARGLMDSDGRNHRSPIVTRHLLLLRGALFVFSMGWA